MLYTIWNCTYYLYVLQIYYSRKKKKKKKKGGLYDGILGLLLQKISAHQPAIYPLAAR